MLNRYIGGMLTFFLVATFVVGPTAQAATVRPRLTNRAILMRSLENVSKAKSLMVIGDVRATETRTYDYTDSLPRTESLTAQFATFLDITNEDHPKALVTVSNLQLQDGGEVYRGGEANVLIDNDVVYFYLDVFSSLPKDFFDYSALEKKWLRIDSNTFGSMAGEEFDLGELKKSHNLTEAQKKQILMALQTYNVLLITRAKDEKLDGVDAYRLQLKLNRGRLVAFLNRVNKIVDGTYMTRAELTDLRREVATATLPTLDLWVDKTQLLPRKVTVNYRQKEVDTLGTNMLTFGLTVNFSNYNDLPTPIVAPAQSEDFMVVLEKVSADMRSQRNSLETAVLVTPVPGY
ncbi:MAG TPA: hypothetical protein VJA27_03910 [Patescibacteria group bacterium]|nr:hypothetical protein [Patescibacteria group bacterium]